MYSTRSRMGAPSFPRSFHGTWFTSEKLKVNQGMEEMEVTARENWGRESTQCLLQEQADLMGKGRRKGHADGQKSKTLLDNQEAKRGSRAWAGQTQHLGSSWAWAVPTGLLKPSLLAPAALPSFFSSPPATFLNLAICIHDLLYKSQPGMVPLTLKGHAEDIRLLAGSPIPASGPQMDSPAILGYCKMGTSTLTHTEHRHKNTFCLRQMGFS